MDSRERVMAAINHREADRVPYDFWGTSEAVDKLKRHWGLPDKEAVLDELDVDLRYIDGPEYVGPALKTFPGDIDEDIWGVKRQKSVTGEGDKRGTYRMVVEAPLANISTIEEAQAYDHWPSPDWYDYSVIEGQCERVREKNRMAVFVGDRTNRVAQFKPYMYIRGMENAYLDMAMNPELFEYITFRISSFYLEYLKRILKAANGKIDIFLTGDDFGGQSNLLCSREMWGQFLKPGFRKFMDVIRAHQVITMHHTCGFVVPIIDDLIECGLDILNPIQPHLPGMEAEMLKKRFGDRIVFHGGIGIQKNLPFGSPEAVRQEVKAALRTLAPGGGYIPCTAHNIQADVPLENILALYEAYREFGRYPIG